MALTGQADFSLLGANGVEFDNTLIASQLNLNQSAGAYPVTLLGNTTITNLLLSYQKSETLDQRKDTARLLR